MGPGEIKTFPLPLTVYIDGVSDDPNHNSPQVFTIQNEETVNPTVQSSPFQWVQNPRIGDYQGGSLFYSPLGWIIREASLGVPHKLEDYPNRGLLC
eukprot:TRINITY_DN46440_c0_g1_i1.p1 TRINITY_DN46440_c0_g1~~TRINITY_DN46440_c0_g1_i1.p1  ORF type:complete len:105 (-),score=9.11 TRINITY_DN46440_c0_g1_i1:129-416(-)